jgi:hypothetical protein
MLYRILLGSVVYLAGAGALAWWLGGIFRRQLPLLGLPVEHLRAAEEWYASHRNVEKLEAELQARAMAQQDAFAHGASRRMA